MITFENLSFTYEGNEKAGGLKDINLHIKRGECVVLCGESGCGKTTMTRLINGLIPHYYEGKLTGKILVDGALTTQQQLYDTARKVGSVFQNPRSQFFNVDTTSEVSFGCENLGVPECEIKERMRKTIQDFHCEHLMERSIFHLSGGQKQKIACASVSVMQPDVFVLDEPSSNLDASSIMELRNILRLWKRQGKTIVVSEHRLFFLRGTADRFLYLKEGKIEKEFSAEAFEALSEEARSDMGLRTYCLERLVAQEKSVQGSRQLVLRNFNFAYKHQPEILHIQEDQIPREKIVAIIGDNGAGKSTFSRCFCGLEKRCGEIVLDGKRLKSKDRLGTCYMVMQEVNHQLFTESVSNEVEISMKQKDEGQVEAILKQLDLWDFKDRHPMSLSGGQKQRVAIASAIASDRSILFFDEPTSGLDFKHMQEVAKVMQALQKSGHTIYIITHDLELILECCTDIIHLEKGKIISQYTVDQEGLQKIKDYFIKESS